MRARLTNSFFKSLLILTSGSILAQIIMIICSPIMTRLFTADQIGMYTYVLSIATLFMPVVNGRYDMSIVTEEVEENIYPLIKLSVIIGSIISIFITLGYYIYIKYFSIKYNDYSYTVGIIFLLLMTYMLNNVLSAYNNRNKEYKIMTKVYIIRTAFQNIGAVIMGVFNAGLIGLLIPYTIGQFMGINKQSKSLMPHLKKIRVIKKEELVKVLKKHYRQPLFSAPAIFANGFSYSSITLFIEALFGMAQVGYYSISVRLLGLPLGLISGNISKIFFEEASKEYNETGQYYKTFKKVFLFQLVLAIPMVLGMIIIVPKVCAIIFGQEWGIAGKYVTILAPMFGIKFIVTAISPGMIISGKQKLELILQIMFIGASIICLIICTLFRVKMETYLMLISISFSIGYIIFLIAVYKNSRDSKSA